uniref:Serine/threonine-protein phosphatase 7 long form homolog n=1 Tax=Nicotiana tabacum TaxID=4097 RepID=A0A1S4AP02_TOBAC
MDLSHVHPGPAADQVLVLQGEHRSSYIWEGHLLDRTLHARRSDDLWEFLKGRVFHARIVYRLRATGFLRIFEIGRMQLNWSLITALIEQWRPETHTFHLPTREATITLQDVPGFVWAACRRTGRCTAPGEAALRGGSRISVTAIREHMEVLHLVITGKTEDILIDRYTILALFLLFGGVLLPNTLGNLVSMRFLLHLQQLDELPQYNWGAAVLAYLYRSMCGASMGTQVWAWQQILPLQPPLPPLEPGVSPPFLPLAT